MEWGTCSAQLLRTDTNPSENYLRHRHLQMATATTSYKIRIMKEDFKFNASHFVAYEGFREKLHGHNYQVGLQLWARQVAADGYVVDFGDIKQVIRSECKRLHERFLSPANSNVLTFTKPDQQLCIECEDGSHFSFPCADCVELPIVHTTVEELAQYFYTRLHEALGDTFAARGVYKLEVIVSEAPGQEASFIQEF